MSVLLRAELLKLRTTRTFAALVGSALLLTLTATVLMTALRKDLGEAEVKGIFAFDFTSLFILLLGVMGMAGEWRHRTITGTVLAAPDRLRLLAAKTLSYAAAGVLLSLIVTVMIMLVGTLILSARGIVTLGAADLLDVLWRNLVVAALLGALGVGLGGLLRNQVVAIVGIFVISFLVEPILFGFVPEVGRFAPFQTAPSAISKYSVFGGNDTSDLLAPMAAVFVLLGWIGVFFALAGARLKKFDLV
ncbi:MAG: type transport system permease protein [Solirubrobacteraceae bacterium]|nr:type transport system permease protein [Solirubrobacteraceae bacterium]